MMDRRGFLRVLGVSAMTTLVLSEVSPAQIAAAQGGGGQPCTYGAGPYGAGLYSGFLAASAPVVLADKSSDDLLLTWSGAPTGTTYEVWRSDQPFVPGDPGSIRIATVTGNRHVDPGVLAAAGDRYYVVRGILTCE